MKIAITTSGGGVAIMTIVNGADSAKCISDWKDVNQGEYISHRVLPDGCTFPPKSLRQYWVDNGTDIVVDNEYTKLLAQAKTVKSAAVQAEKVRVRDGGFLVSTTLFDSDANANVQYLNFFTQVSQNPSYVVEEWKASAGVWVRMDITLFMQVSTGFSANTAAAFSWQSARDAEIAVATTVEEVQAVSEHYNG